MKRLHYATGSVLLVALIAAFFSFAKFQHCVNSGFISPDNYVHTCYTDVAALYGARGLDQHQWPYSSASNSVEYPPVTGVVMWVTALMNPHRHSYVGYFYINAFLLALLFIGSVYLLSRMKPQFWYLFPLSPVVVASLFINWDLWAVLSALGSILLFDKKRYEWSAILLGLSIATKFFPIVLLTPIALIFLKRQELKRLVRYVGVTTLSWFLINLPFALFTWDGWLRFFTLNKDRPADFGSFYYAVQLLFPNRSFTWTKSGSVVLFILLTAAAAIYFFYLAKPALLSTLAIPSFAFVAIFTVTSKVYSPQYILWITPLAILAMRSYKARAPFWIWQGCELIYHLAIWEYLAQYTGAKFGITGFTYALATLLRIAATIYFGVRVYVGSPDLEPETIPALEVTV